MMPFQLSLNFLLFFTLSISIFNVIDYLPKKFTNSFPFSLKNIFILLISLFFLYYFGNLPAIKLASLIIALTFFFFSTKNNSNHRSLLNKKYIVSFLIIVLILLKIAQYYNYNVFLMAGMSYLLLKLIHYSIEKNSERISDQSFLGFLNFSLFFPVFSSGPIVSYNDFQKELHQQHAPHEKVEFITEGFKRIILGLFKTVVVAKILSNFTIFQYDEIFLSKAPFLYLVFFFYITIFDLYFNFSGFCDLAIGVSKCLGIKVPENFNKPFSSRNLQEFWSRWHITLAVWLKQYIFYPFNMYLARRIFFKMARYSPVFAIFLTFFIMGLWHGINKNYILYGLFQGLGLAIVSLWDQYLKRKKLMSKYHSLTVLRPIAQFITITYFGLSLLLFYATDGSHWSKLQVIIGRVF